jgi:hypothetical protein
MADEDGTTVSPRRCDAAARHALHSANPRRPYDLALLLLSCELPIEIEASS